MYKYRQLVYPRKQRLCRAHKTCWAAGMLVVVVVAAVAAACWWWLYASWRPVAPGPAIRASAGAVWPQPRHLVKTRDCFALHPDTFKFTVTGAACEVLVAALPRYDLVLRREAAVDVPTAAAGVEAPRQNLSGLHITVNHCEAWPGPHMDETYRLSIVYNASVAAPVASLDAPSVWGALRGLETFVQLLSPGGSGSLLVNASEVQDGPRFPHRGLLLDTSRHFLPAADILLELDAMAAVKLNVLHWHIVDDQSFPWQSARFPELSGKGAYHPRLVYTAQDVRNIIEHARLRGIRVIPEFDTPGHTRSWGEGRPELLASCGDGTFANIDPTKVENLAFLRQLFAEVAASFPDSALHLGGDEVHSLCWSKDPGVRAYMKENGYGSDYHRLQAVYLGWLSGVALRLNKTAIVWQEAVAQGHEGLLLRNRVIAQVWYGTIFSSSMHTVKQLTDMGFRTILSAGWYLADVRNTWQSMYHIEPQDFAARSQAQLDLVLGGEVCMWGETVDEAAVHSRVWPGAAAVAERLWSPRTTTDLGEAARRLEELVCRLRRRGVPAAPANGPGFCPP